MDMETKFTPGPWHLKMSDNATPHIMHERGADWTDIDDHSSLVCHMPAEIASRYNSFANARLIAAAPELLAALIEARAQIAEMCLACRIPFPESSMERYDEAIDKATGSNQ